MRHARNNKEPATRQQISRPPSTQRGIVFRDHDRFKGLTYSQLAASNSLANTNPKDMSRPTTQHRLSVGSNASSLPVRTSYSRSHSHTFSAGSTIPTHRVNRRKSSTFSPPNVTALAAVEQAVTAGSLPVNRRSSASKAALASLNDGGFHPVPSNLQHHVSLPENSASAVVDGPALSSFQSIDKTKNRARRASDGTRLTKKEKAASGELKCEQCGKAYKHGSCLNKHL